MTKRITSLFLICFPLFGHAKDLVNRLGFGISELGPGQLPALSVDWRPTQATAFEFNLSINTESSNNTLSFGTRYQRHLYIEDQLFYFLYMGGGIMSQQVSGKSASGFYVSSGAGSKFFLSGLPNLGFSYGGGLKLASISSVSFQSEVYVGMHYYF